MKRNKTQMQTCLVNAKSGASHSLIENVNQVVSHDMNKLLEFHVQNKVFRSTVVSEMLTISKPKRTPALRNHSVD